MLFAGTPDGVYRVPRQPFDRAEQVFNAPVRQLQSDGDGVLAATDAGVVRMTDGGDSWTNLGLADVHAVDCTGSAIYAGGRPAELYRSDDGGETWERQESFGSFAADADWPTNPHRDEAWVRTIASLEGREILLVGVEVGGFLASTDGGESWKQFDAVPDDVHDVLPISPERWVVSCGVGGPDERGGVFETTDGGVTWTERDLGPYEYVRESCYRDRLYTAGNQTRPLWTPPEAALFVERDGELDRAAYPGEPESFVISFATSGADVLAGTNDGAILHGRGGEWEQLGTVPVAEDDQGAWGVRSLAVTEH
ncbi:WD40/YVTN/BNR-like repeat-containing protein [Halovenus rubra]|uniref:WD40/YVTN/BNR-like repeat-containing protein n=2 Tax=Halovenus rubra TaxID=869890 RepID=A0ABD5X8L7_9EURY|nr:hypothetical protein [Halovenus rubra]